MLAISQLGEAGYVAQVSATAEASGTIVGTLNGRISIFDERTDPSQQWVNCDSAEHRFSLKSIAR